MTKQIIAIWAEDEKKLIGREGSLPWRLPKELQHFKETTTGQVLLMGRVTFEGMNRRILPGRETLILSSEPDFEAEGVLVMRSIQEVLDWFYKQEKTLFVVGGARVYKSMEAHYDGLIKTTVHGDFEGDTYFPELDWSDFKMTDEITFEADETNHHAFTVSQWSRRKS